MYTTFSHLFKLESFQNLYVCVLYNMEHRNEKLLKRMMLVSVGGTENGLVQSCVIANTGLKFNKFLHAHLFKTLETKTAVDPDKYQTTLNPDCYL